MKISNKIYDFLKYFLCVVVPACTALLIGLEELYDFAWVDVVIRTIPLGATFLGAIFCIQNASYNAKKVDGKIVLAPDDEEK